MKKRLFSVLALSVMLVMAFSASALATAVGTAERVSLKIGETKTLTFTGSNGKWEITKDAAGNQENDITWITYYSSSEEASDARSKGQSAKGTSLTVIVAPTDGATDTTLYVSNAGDDNPSTLTITITAASPSGDGGSTTTTATAPVFSSTTIKIQEGASEYSLANVLKSTPSNGTITWTAEDAKLDAVGLEFDTNKLKASDDDGASAGTGTIKLTATHTLGEASKSTTATFTVNVSGTTPTITTTGFTGSDYGKALDSKNGGIVQYQEIQSDDAEVSIKVEASKSGLAVTTSGLSDGLTWNIDSDDKDGNTKVAVYTLKVVGTPTKAGTYKPKVSVINSLTTKAVEKEYTLKVLPFPTITAAITNNITWGTKNVTALSPTSAAGTVTWSISDDEGKLPKVSFDNGVLGLTFDTKKGTIKGTWNKNGTAGGIYTGSTVANMEKHITLTATAYGVTASKDVTLTFVPAAPTISTKAAAVETSLKAFSYSVDVSSADSKVVKVTAIGPGTITYSIGETTIGTADTPIDSVASGLKARVTSDDDGTYLHIFGKPAEVVSKKEFTITASNGFGTAATLKPKATTTTASEDITLSAGLPSGDASVGTTIDEITLTATPSLVKWKATNLPKGLTLKDNTDGTATLSGKYTKVTTKDKNGQAVYTITATSTINSKAVATLSADLNVYDKPVISTTKLNDLTVNTAYKVDLKYKNDPNPGSWDVKFINESEDAYANGADTYTAPNGNYTLSFTSKDNVFSISGSLDRVPTGGTVKVRITAENVAGEVSKDLTLKVKGVAPAFKTASIKTLSATEASAVVETTGTLPITMKAYIAPADAKKIFGTDGTQSIDLIPEDNAALEELPEEGNTTGLYFRVSEDSDSTNGDQLGKGTLYLIPSAKKAYKALPITFEASNTTKTVTKKLTVNVSGAKPVWTVASGDDEAFASAGTAKTITATASQDIGTEEDVADRTGYRFMVSGDEPITVTISQKLGLENAKNGIYITSEDADDDSGKTVYTVQGAPTKGKETKTAITFTAKNPSTGESAVLKLTIEAKMPPEISSRAAQLKKEVEIGKKLSIKPSVKGSKTIKWVITDEDSNDVSAELKNTYGLSFTTSTGELSGTTKAVTTSEEDEMVYASRDYYVQAGNSAGSSDVVVYTIGIKGTKPKFQTKQVTFDRLEPDFEDEKNAVLKTDIKTDAETTKAHVTYEPATEAEGDKLKDLGFSATIDSETQPNYGILAADSLKEATKGTAVKITASNFGTDVTGNVKIVINDPKPEITDANGDTAMQATDQKEDYPVVFTLENAPTGDNKIKWAIKTKPAKVSAKITETDDDKGTATVTITVPKNFKNVVQGEDTDLETKVSVTATNTITKAVSDAYDFEFTVTPIDTTNNSAKPEEGPTDVAAAPEADAEKSADEATEEKAAVYGKAGSVESLTEAQRSAIEEAGYIIVAVYDDVKVPEDNTYDFAFEVADGVKTGSEFAYFVFKAEEEANDDEKYAEFFDEDGAPVESVPESKKAEVSAWFSADSTYKSVVAVKADKAAADAVAESEIEEKAE